MTIIHVRVQFGKDYLEVDIGSDGTFGDIREQIEQRMGLVHGGVKLLYKGKRYGDSVAITSVGIRAISESDQLSPPKNETVNMMAMRTQLQHEKDRQNEKLQRLNKKEHNSDTKRVLDNEQSKRVAGSSSLGRGSVIEGPMTAVKADSKSHIANPVSEHHQNPSETMAVSSENTPVDNATSVFVSKGRNRFRVNVDLEGNATGREVKERLCALGGEWAGWAVKDIRLLAKGRVVKDDQVLKDVGLRYGDTMMALVSGSRHAAGEASREMTKISYEIQTLLSGARSLDKRVRTRVLSTEDAIVQVEELKRECQRLRGNVDVADRRSDSTETSGNQIMRMKSDLDDVEAVLEGLS